jgi:hypothetical protein
MKPILLIVAIVIAVVVVGAMRRARKPAEMPFPEMLAILPKEAVSIAKDSYGITLDYSPASVEKVEEILGKLYVEYQKKKTTEGQRGLALAFGVYIGEVIKKEAGEGRWERDHPTMGEGAMPLYWKGGASFPVAWCLKRLANGDEDNVWHKYLFLVREKLEKKEANQPSEPTAPSGRGSP